MGCGSDSFSWIKFAEERWGIKFSNQAQVMNILHISFVKDGRIAIPELAPEESVAPQAFTKGL